MGTITRTYASETRESARLSRRCRAAICYSEVERLFPNSTNGQRERLIFNRPWRHDADGKAFLNNTVTRWAAGICTPRPSSIAKIEHAAGMSGDAIVGGSQLREWALSPFWDLFGPVSPAKEVRRSDYLNASVELYGDTEMIGCPTVLRPDIRTLERLLRARDWRSLVTCLLLTREAEGLNQVLGASLAYSCAYWQLSSVLRTSEALAAHARDFVSLMNLLAPAPLNCGVSRNDVRFLTDLASASRFPAEFGALATLVMARAQAGENIQVRRDPQNGASPRGELTANSELHDLIVYVLAQILNI